jgi:dipeptide/tripeptide permease
MQYYGLVIIAAAALFVMLITMRRQPWPIKLFALALITVGLGYLATTHAPAEIAAMLFGTGEVKVAPLKTN